MRLQNHEKKVIVATKLNTNLENYIKSVHNFTRRLNMRPKFTHVIEPWTAPQILYPREYISWEIADLSEKIKLREAASSLQKRLQEITHENDIDQSVIIGQPGEAVEAEAISTMAAMVICGYTAKSHRFIPKGFSTALELMADCPIPVLLLPEGNIHDFTKKQLNMVVFDDLSATSAAVLSVATELACALKNTEIYHVHIHKESQSQILEWAEKMNELMASTDYDYDAIINRETIIAEMGQAIDRELDQRLPVSPANLRQNNVHYHRQIHFGHVFTNVAETINSIAPDFIVFGKHRFMHKNPITIGKVPYYTMLNFQTPILVVPNSP